MKYKILVHNSKNDENQDLPVVKTVLYNDIGLDGQREVREIPFIERRISKNAYYASDYKETTSPSIIL